MRKAIGWTLAWTLFWIGHWISIPLNARYGEAEVLSKPVEWIFGVYSRIMVASSDVQDWGGVEPGVGPWGPVIKGEESDG